MTDIGGCYNCTEIMHDRTKNDCISRQAAIDALKEEEYPCESDYDEGYMAALKKSIWIMEKWLPSVQSEHTCVGCKHRGNWENEVEYGYNSPCTKCRRRTNDNYEQ